MAVAIFAYGMPTEMAGKAAMYGGFTGLLPIGWIVLNIIFLQQLAWPGARFYSLRRYPVTHSNHTQKFRHRPQTLEVARTE